MEEISTDLRNTLTTIQRDISRLEVHTEKLFQESKDSSARQGDRIGKLEQSAAEMRRDFYWATRLTTVVWAVIQGVGMVLLAWYLRKP